MAVYMFLTEAMIPCALRAIPEIEARVIGVGFSADAALVCVRSAVNLFFRFLHFLFKVCYVILTAAFGFARDNIRAAKDNEIKDCYYRQKVKREGLLNYFHYKQQCIQISQIFDFYGDYEKEKNLHVGKKSRESKKHRQVNKG